MWEFDHKEVWALNNWWLWKMVLEKILEDHLECTKIKPVSSKGSQSCILIGRTDDEADALILWPPDVKSWFIRKDSDAGKDWKQEEKGTTKDEMVGWHHWFTGQEFEQTLGYGEGLGSLVCCSAWWWQESDMTQWTITIIFYSSHSEAAFHMSLGTKKHHYFFLCL